MPFPSLLCCYCHCHGHRVGLGAAKGGNGPCPLVGTSTVFSDTHTHSLPPSLEPSQSSLSHNRQAPPTPPALHCPASLLGWGPLIRCSRPVPRGCSGCTAPVSPQILCPGTPPSEAWRGAILTASLETWVHQVRCRLLLSAHLARVCLWGRGTDWPRGSIWLRTARPV